MKAPDFRAQHNSSTDIDPYEIAMERATEYFRRRLRFDRDPKAAALLHTLAAQIAKQLDNLSREERAALADGARHALIEHFGREQS